MRMGGREEEKDGWERKGVGEEEEERKRERTEGRV